MRIAYLSSDFGVPVLGSKGCSVHVREITRGLRNLGHEVRIYSPEPGADDGAAERAGVYPLPMNGLASKAVRHLNREELGVSKHMFRELRRLLYSEQLKSRLLPILEEYRPDAIYERYTLFGYTGVELARELGVPLLLEVNAPLAEEGARRRGWVLSQSASAMEAEVVRRADAVMVVSNAVGEHVAKLGASPGRIELLPNGVDPERFDPATSGADVRREYGLEGKTVVGYVGSLRVWHDLGTVMKAVDLLNRSDLEVHFLPVGGGEQVAEMQREDHVTCPGFVPHERVPEFIAAMDVAIVPFGGGNERYFSPMKLYEFMAMGKPTVGARMGQVTDFIVPGETGFLYEPGDPVDLAACIRKILKRPDRGASLGAAARQLVIEDHTWEARARQIVDLAIALRTDKRSKTKFKSDNISVRSAAMSQEAKIISPR